jgi:hypothetical protein
MPLRQEKAYIKRHTVVSFQKGDLVLLSTKNIRFKMSHRKLLPKFIGPFRVLEVVGKQAYCLALPQQYGRLHNVFPISLLEPWKGKQTGNQADTLPMPELEEIKGERELHSETYFLVKWKGWPSE